MNNENDAPKTLGIGVLLPSAGKRMNAACGSGFIKAFGFVVGMEPIGLPLCCWNGVWSIDGSDFSWRKADGFQLGGNRPVENHSSTSIHWPGISQLFCDFVMPE